MNDFLPASKLLDCSATWALNTPSFVFPSFGSFETTYDAFGQSLFDVNSDDMIGWAQKQTKETLEALIPAPQVYVIPSLRNDLNKESHEVWQTEFR